MPVRNPIGASAWIWVSPATDERLAALVPRLRAWGFDLVELPVEAVGDWDTGRTAELLAEHGLGATVCAVMPPGRELVAADHATVRETQDYLRACVDAAVAVGSGVVAGPIYASVGRRWRLAPGEYAATLQELAANLRGPADYAAQRGVRLALEPLNRFETSLLTTAADAAGVVDLVGSTGLGLLLDTFHMNIEERDPAAAVRLAGPRLAHFHACANDRGAPGTDHLDWPALALALSEIGYEGALVIESFTPENETIATAAAVWRSLAPSQDAIATDGLAFLRALLTKGSP